jgi:uncharacterized protein
LILDDLGLDARFAALPHLKQIAFSASCCERLIPNYQLYDVVGGTSDSRLLRKLLDYVWAYVADTPNLEGLEETLQRSRAIEIETESASSQFISQALDALDAITITAECCLNNRDPQKVVAQACLDTIHSYLYWVNDSELDSPMVDSELDQLIDTLPMMRREVACIVKTLDLMDSSTTLTPEVIRESIVLSLDAGIQPFKRGFSLIRLPTGPIH